MLILILKQFVSIVQIINRDGSEQVFLLNKIAALLFAPKGAYH